jgi:hypothetical protein
MGASVPEEKRKGRLTKKKGNKPQFHLRTGLYRLYGPNPDRQYRCHDRDHGPQRNRIRKWETENHFVPWLRLCPDNRISGEKIIGKGGCQLTNREFLEAR